jgi:thiol-disulfide isomerase/thioredoxin
MTILHLLLISSAVTWLLLIGLAVSVVRIEKAVVGLQARTQDGPPVGSVAPELVGMVNEGPHSMGIGSGEFEIGSPKLVWFMESGCGPCEHVRPLVGELAAEYQEDVTCWVNYLGTSEAAVEFARHWSSPVRVLADPDGRNHTRWQIRRVPSVVLLGSDGLVVWKGGPSRRSIKEALDGPAGRETPFTGRIEHGVSGLS